MFDSANMDVHVENFWTNTGSNEWDVIVKLILYVYYACEVT